MRRLLALLLMAFAVATLVPNEVRAAGDASAIRRATRTEDSRYVSNYRPGAKSSYRRYSMPVRTNTKAVAQKPAASRGR